MPTTADIHGDSLGLLHQKSEVGPAANFLERINLIANGKIEDKEFVFSSVCTRVRRLLIRTEQSTACGTFPEPLTSRDKHHGSNVKRSDTVTAPSASRSYRQCDAIPAQGYAVHNPGKL